MANSQNNSQNTALMQMQSQYEGCNLLLPMSTESQINPYYKLTAMQVQADVSENSGDIFKVGSVKKGDSWVDTFSPAKPLLMKLSTAAGIDFDPAHTYGTRVSKNIYKAKARGAVRLPDGTFKTHSDEKTIDLDDEEDGFRLEFMDKSIEGITDDKAAKAAAKMFKGEWVDAENKWGKECKAYKIADEDRQKYIDRSVMVNMTLLRKTAAEKAMTGAINRVIRALLGMKGQYTKAELLKPFAVLRMTFSPDYNNPEVRQAMLAQGLNSISNMFGITHIAGSTQHDDEPEDVDIFSISDFDNPAFASGEPVAPQPQTESIIDKEETPPETPAPTPKEGTAAQHMCMDCGAEISESVAGYSKRNFDVPLCINCQKGVKS